MRSLFRIGRIWLVVCLCLAAHAAVANAQCTPHPSHETTLSVINASRWRLFFPLTVPFHQSTYASGSGFSGRSQRDVIDRAVLQIGERWQR